MKKILKSFTFWLLLIAVLVIIMHQMGRDSLSIMLIWFNPVLNMIADNRDGVIFNFVESGPWVPCNILFESEISIYWYIGSVLTYAILGVVLDCIRWGVRRLYKKLWSQL